MPGVGYANPYVQYAGFQFDYNNAFLSCASQYNIGAISSFNTASISSLNVSSINGAVPGTGSAVSSFNTLSASSLTVSSINGLSLGSLNSNVFNSIQVLPQTIPSGATNVLTLSAVSDPNSWWNSSTYRFKPTVAGYYFISAQLTFNPSIPDQSELGLKIVENFLSVNLAITILGGFDFNAGAQQTLTATALHYFDGIDTNVSALAYNDTAGDITVATGAGLTSFQAFLIGGSPGPAGPPGPSGLVSTLSTFNTLSASSFTVSSINGTSYNTALSTLNNVSTVLGNISTVSTFNTLSASSFTVSSMNGTSYDTALSTLNNVSTVVGNISTVSTFNTLSVSSATISSINSLPIASPVYNLLGSTISSVITNKPIGEQLSTSQFNLATTLQMSVPPTWKPTDSVFYDGWALYNFNATALNTFWGVSYITNTYASPIDILGSTTTSNAALNYPNASQVYMPVNIVIPPTHLSTTGTITLSYYVFVAVGGQFFAADPIINGRVGTSLD